MPSTQAKTLQKELGHRHEKKVLEDTCGKDSRKQQGFGYP